MTLRNPKHEHFVQALVIGKQDPADAYMTAGYIVKDRLRASELACRLQKNAKVSTRIQELLNNDLKTAQKTSISTLHEKAVETASQILNTGNDYAKISVLKAVLDRSEPVIKQSQSVHVTVSSKDQDKRRALLERKRQQVKAIESPVSVDVPVAPVMTDSTKPV